MNVVLCSSGGKDSVLAWHVARADASLNIVGQLTTFSAAYDRVTMHGVRRELLRCQAEAMGLKLYEMLLPSPGDASPPQPAEPLPPSPSQVLVSNDVYEAVLAQICRTLRAEGIKGLIFGDVHLQDVRDYRERTFAALGMTLHFPLWGRDPAELMETFWQAGFAARTVCVDGRKLGREHCGQPLSREFVASLPDGVDPCGENGEFHSFVYDGPGFAQPVAHTLGETVWREPFWYGELLPG